MSRTIDVWMQHPTQRFLHPYIDQVALDFPELTIVCGHVGSLYLGGNAQRVFALA